MSDDASIAKQETNLTTDGGGVDAKSPPAPSPSDLILKLTEERQANEKVLAEMKKIQAEQLEMHARFALGGRSEAGQQPPKEKTIDDIAEEMAMNVVKKYWKQ